jgi:hypothetical protein
MKYARRWFHVTALALTKKILNALEADSDC